MQVLAVDVLFRFIYIITIETYFCCIIGSLASSNPQNRRQMNREEEARLELQFAELQQAIEEDPTNLDHIFDR